MKSPKTSPVIVRVRLPTIPVSARRQRKTNKQQNRSGVESHPSEAYGHSSTFRAATVKRVRKLNTYGGEWSEIPLKSF